jgi:hypothetical protein
VQLASVCEPLLAITELISVTPAPAGLKRPPVARPAPSPRSPSGPGLSASKPPSPFAPMKFVEIVTCRSTALPL